MVETHAKSIYALPACLHAPNDDSAHQGGIPGAMGAALRGSEHNCNWPGRTFFQHHTDVQMWKLLRFLRNFVSHFVQTPLLVGLQTRHAKERVLYGLYQNVIGSALCLVWYSLQ